VEKFRHFQGSKQTSTTGVISAGATMVSGSEQRSRQEPEEASLEMAESDHHLYDTHPSLKDRIVVLEMLPAPSRPQDDYPC
jgi:hypothetical protein